MNFKSLIPKSIKLQLKIIQRKKADKDKVFATIQTSKNDYQYKITTEQEIKKGLFYENKIHNITTAANKTESIIIQPGELFSFWKIVGRPNKKNNYKQGRNIVKGKVSSEIGGGLCQLSSIIYITALKANLEIIERYNHSVDIYKEEDRFTPLGADATVVYGYKDLRIKNNYSFPIRFSFTFIDSNINCHIESPEQITEKQLNFVRDYKENKVEVTTSLDSNIHCVSIYEIMAL